MKPTSSFGILLLILVMMSGIFSSPENSEDSGSAELALTGPSLSSFVTTSVSIKEEPESDPAGQKQTIFPCDSCDHIIYESVNSGRELNIKPGEIVCLHAKREYNRLTFKDIKGTKEMPVTIRNCDGVTKIYSNSSFGIKFQQSEHFRLVGDGSEEEYGILITTEKGFFLTMEYFTTDFEITRVEIAGADKNGIGEKNGFAGIGAKTSPYQDCELFSDPTRTAWIMRNVSIHDNYIHDVGGEGIYMGHGMYAGRKEKGCKKTTWSHSIKGVRVYNNRIENVGFDGIQIKNADEDVQVYNNVIKNYGTRGHGSHNEGLFIGEGTVGSFYNNLVDTGTGTGCQIQGMGDLNIYNNVFANQQDYGIYAAHGDMVIRKPDAPFNIFNNTIYNAGKMGYVFYNDDGGPKRFINNLVVNTPAFTKKDATTMMENNVFTNDESIVRFIDSEFQNYCLKIGSIAIDAGTDLSSYGITQDCQGNPRPAGKGFDIGAYEFLH